MTTNDENLTIEERARRFVDKKMEERNGLIGHAIAFVVVNTFLWSIFLSSGSDFPWPLIVSGGWGIGLVAHFFSYWTDYGPGRERKEAMIQREIEKERARMIERGYYDKRKNDSPTYRLTEDGELVQDDAVTGNDQYDPDYVDRWDSDDRR